jgi:pimeloyl-ACP methyl ester carboxylesterase
LTAPAAAWGASALASDGVVTVERLEAGSGPAALLLHSSASGAGQWRALAEALQPSRRVIAPNLYGYGRTPPWPGTRPQTVGDQAELALAAVADVDAPVDIVGHSFGAVVALDVATALGARVRRVVLFEPNPFALLRAPGLDAERAAVEALYGHVRRCAACGDWPGLAARFVDFFSGEGAWAATPELRRAAVVAALRPNPHEWDAVMDPALDSGRWRAVRAPILLVHARDSRRPLRVLAAALGVDHPGWTASVLDRGGHMAPLTRPRPFNALVAAFLG